MGRLKTYFSWYIAFLAICAVSCHNGQPTRHDHTLRSLVPSIAWKAAGKQVFPQHVDTVEIRIVSESFEHDIVKRFAFSQKKATFPEIPLDITINVHVYGLTTAGDTLYKGLIDGVVVDQRSTLIPIHAEMVSPPEPSQLTTEKLPDGSVRLEWKNNAVNEQYILLIKTIVGSQQVDSIKLPPNTQSWTDTMVTAHEKYFYALLANNLAGYSLTRAEASVEITPRIGLRLAYRGDLSCIAGETVSVSIGLSDSIPDTGISIEAAELPPEASYGDGVLYWHTQVSDTGEHHCTFVAVDSTARYESDTLFLTITVNKPTPNKPPTIVIDSFESDFRLTVSEGDSIGFTVSVSDSDGNDTHLAPLIATPWDSAGTGSYDTVSGRFVFRPSFDMVTGESMERNLGFFTFTAFDNGIPPQSAHITVEIVVTDSNSAPQWSSDTIVLNVLEGELFTYDLSNICIDHEDDSIRYMTETGTIVGSRWEWRPPFDTISPVHISIEATDTRESAGCILEIQISDSNRVPVAYDNRTIQIVEDSTAFIKLEAHDPDSTMLSWLVNEPLHGTVSGTPPEVVYRPDNDFAGVDSFTFTVTDNIDTSEAATILITVLPVNDPPVILGAKNSLSMYEDSSRALTVADFIIEDPDDSIFSIHIEGGENYTVDGARVIPAENFNGELEVTVYAIDEEGLAGPPITLIIKVIELNDPPVIVSISDKRVAEGELCEFSVIATDVDGPQPIISATGFPGNVDERGNFSWQTGYDDSGTYVVTVEATDAEFIDVSVSKTFTIVVENVDRAPYFTTVPGNNAIAVGKSVRYTESLQAVDNDNDPIRFALVNGPGDMQVVGNEVVWDIDRLQVKPGTYPVIVQANANGKSVDTSWNVEVTPHVWEKFSTLPEGYYTPSRYSGNKNYIAFASKDECYRINGGYSEDTVCLEKLTVGESWECLNIKFTSLPISDIKVAGNNAIIAGWYYLVLYAIDASVPIDTAFVGPTAKVEVATKENGNWFATYNSSWMGGTESKMMKNGILQYAYDGSITWNDLEVTPENNVVCLLSDGSNFHYTDAADNTMADLADRKIDLGGDYFAELELDRNDGDTAFVLDTLNHVILRTDNAYTNPVFSDTITCGASIQPKTFKMLSGYAGWVVGEDGIAYFTNDGFATIPVAEQTSDGGLIERIYISADGEAEFAVGRDNAGVKALYRY